MYSLYKLRFYLSKMKSSKPANTKPSFQSSRLSRLWTLSGMSPWNQSGNTGLETVAWKKRWWRIGTLQSSKVSCKRTQHCWLTASSIVGCCMLRLFAHPVGSCCAISVVPWSPKRSATMYAFAQLFQYCWGHARAFHVVYKVLLVFSFQRCTAGPNMVGSCCIRLSRQIRPEPVGFRAVFYLWMGNNAYRARG